MKNPFDNGPDKAELKYRENLQKWEKMAESPADRAILRSQPREVIERIGPRIEAAWMEKAANSGELFSYTEKMPTGHEAVKYAGDIRAAYAHCTLRSVPFQMSKTVRFGDRTYLEGSIPPSIQREMAIARIGGRDWK